MHTDLFTFRTPVLPHAEVHVAHVVYPSANGFVRNNPLLTQQLMGTREDAMGIKTVNLLAPLKAALIVYSLIVIYYYYYYYHFSGHQHIDQKLIGFRSIKHYIAGMTMLGTFTPFLPIFE